jgi:hypothetical protein
LQREVTILVGGVTEDQCHQAVRSSRIVPAPVLRCGDCPGMRIKGRRARRGNVRGEVCRQGGHTVAARVVADAPLSTSPLPPLLGSLRVGLDELAFELGAELGRGECLGTGEQATLDNVGDAPRDPCQPVHDHPRSGSVDVARLERQARAEVPTEADGEVDLAGSRRGRPPHGCGEFLGHRVVGVGRVQRART